ncbi:MAG TPA: hypothetical protein VF837_01640 [Patescibacteria group bacterium]
MSAIERHKCLQVNISTKNPFELNLPKDGGVLKLSVIEPDKYGEGTTKESQELVRTVMLAHLIAPYMPEIIETNFGVTSTQFLNELYRHYGFNPPKIKRSSEQIQPQLLTGDLHHQDIVDFASAHSGGLDSAYRLAKLMEEKRGVVGVHIRNLNAKGNYSEAIASEKQCSEWEIPYKQIRLLNNSGNFGFDTMRTRDFLLAVLTALAVKPNQVKKIFIEGDMGTDPQKSHFSEYVGGWEIFNKLLKDVGLDMTVEGMDAGDIETVGEVIELERKLNIQIIPLIQNCFSSPFQIPNNRRKWERETPTIAKSSSEHWCGSCLKCRRMTLGRIFYQDPRLSEISEDEIDFFKKDTYIWMKKYPHSADLITPSFLNHLENL